MAPAVSATPSNFHPHVHVVHYHCAAAHILGAWISQQEPPPTDLTRPLLPPTSCPSSHCIAVQATPDLQCARLAMGLGAHARAVDAPFSSISTVLHLRPVPLLLLLTAGLPPPVTKCWFFPLNRFLSTADHFVAACSPHHGCEQLSWGSSGSVVHSGGSSGALWSLCSAPRFSMPYEHMICVGLSIN